MNIEARLEYLHFLAIIDHQGSNFWNNFIFYRNLSTQVKSISLRLGNIDSVSGCTGTRIWNSSWVYFKKTFCILWPANISAERRELIVFNNETLQKAKIFLCKPKGYVLDVLKGAKIEIIFRLLCISQMMKRNEQENFEIGKNWFDSLEQDTTG